MRFSWLTIRDILSCCRTEVALRSDPKTSGAGAHQAVTIESSHSTVRPGPRSAEVDEARIMRDHCNFRKRSHKGERIGCRTRMAAKP